MAVTVDQTSLGTGNASGSNPTLTTTGAVAAGGHIIVVAGRFNSTNSTMAVSGGALTWTQDHTAVSGSIRTSVFRAPAPAGLAASTVLTLTHTGGGVADSIFGAASYLGIDTVGTVVAVNGGGASTAAWSSGSVAGNSGDALVGGAFVDAGAVSSSVPTAPAVERIDRNIAGQSESLTMADILSLSGATALAGTWNAAGGHVAVAVAYKAAAGGGGGTVVKQLAALGVG